MSTVDGTKTNGLFNSGKGNLTSTFKKKTTNFLTVMIIRYWNRLPGEAAETLSPLKPLKSKLDKHPFRITKI